MPVPALLLLLLCCSAACQSPPEAAVSSGRLQGKWMRSRDGRSIAAFQGIPYAAPPVGNLRFQAPERPLPWTGVRLAADRGEPCTQRSSTSSQQVVGQEDCLFLNVYVPQNSTALDVLVYIHGGAFYMGAGYTYTPEYLLDHDVILVTFNYRLGPLGFLSTSDDVIPGNTGLKDQVQALHWVKENIRAFGGNPGNVTIYGQSAGSASVHLLTLSPLAKGLFHRAVGQSATAQCPWAFSEPGEPLRVASQLAQVLGCPAEPSAALRDCLLGLPAVNVTGADYDLFGWRRLDIAVFKPVVEAAGVKGAFLTQHPRDILASSGPESDVPLIMGFNSQDGGTWAADIHGNQPALQLFNDNFEAVISVMLNVRQMPKKLVDDSTKQLRRFYYGDYVLSNDTRENSIDLFTDLYFLWPTIRTMRLLMKHRKSPIYLYEFAYHGRASVVSGETPFFEYGVGHSDDLYYIFPMSSRLVRTEDDVKMSRSFVQFLTNFVSKGAPTEDGSWRPVLHPEAPEYLRIASPGDKALHRNCAPERLLVWKQLPAPIGDGPMPSRSSRAALVWMWSSSVLTVVASIWNSRNYY